MQHDQAKLSLVTTEPHPDTVTVTDVEPCDGTYTCICPACRTEVAAKVARGVRRKPQLPLKRAA